MEVFKAIIVDDGELARADLLAVLSDFENVKVVGEAENLKQARKLLIKKDPDLVFLDIQMPGEIGFDLVPDIPFGVQIIFVTAFDQYALRAFEVNALDYLLKPVSSNKIQNILHKLSGQNQEEVKTDSLSFKIDDTIFVKLPSTYQFLKIDQIVKIEGADDHSEVLTMDGKTYKVFKPLKEWENRLPESHFCRIHRSTMVNLNKIERLEPWFNSAFRVYLKDLKEPVQMSRRYFSKIKERLG